MRIRVAARPGVTTERQHPVGLDTDEIAIDDVLVDGVYVGQVVYRRRRHRTGGGATYGWQPVKAARNSRLSTRADAIDRLLNQRSQS